MRMMKQILTLLLIVSSVMTVSSQGNAASNDPAAKKVLDAVSVKFKTFKTLKSTFTYKVENGAGKVLSTKKGTVFMKGNKYRVSFIGQEIFCDGSNVWTFDNSANEVTITKLDASGGSITPQKLFTDFYDKDFLYKLNGEKKNGAKTIQEIEMTPIDKNKTFHKVYIYVDKAAKTITGTKVLEKAGSTYVYDVNTLQPNTAINDSYFVFDEKKYPGVEVIDLR
ncbi:MAG: outer membrane lipoprotein carrier protein LolA [Terrimonas sp.]|nr:outer membrane lipoprotein carrier protein LolA [Terrimonas sp.]